MTRIAFISAFATLLIFAMPAIILLLTGDYVGPSSFYGLTEDSYLVDRVFAVRELFTFFK